MIKNSAVTRGSSRWQEIRARAIDATFDSDRRRVGERVAVVFRWLFLIVLGVLNNAMPHAYAEAKVTADLVLAGWAAMNVAVNVLLARGYSPGKQFSLTTMVLDIFFAAGLVYLSDGFGSPFFLAMFLAVIANAVRFGATASFLSALVISVIYLFIGGSFTPTNFYIDPKATIGTIFLFLVVALAVGYMTRELERERRKAVEHAAQADSLRELSLNLVTNTDIKDVFAVLIDNAVHMTTAERGRVILRSRDGFNVIASGHRDGAEATASEDEAIDEHALSQAAGTGEAVFASDRRTLSVPIASADGVTALVSLSAARPFSNQDLFVVDALSGSSAVPIANALRFERSREEATTDGLTGLTNAREFRRRLDASFGRPERRQTPLSLLLIDFDHFKSVNDELGHQHGDLVLQMGARIVRSTARAQDLVARYGGDELAVLVADTNGAAAQRLAYRIVDAVRAAAVSTT
ncbi:MAG TPA: diguanylate cyclase, partial [Candidatus Sulfotelmatobacter sp.]|nr:diguanylate cyclase [Candidatus Sulfotelmatobacter sp.]